MCCLFTTLLLLGPRAAIIVWWIAQPGRWDAAFSIWLWPMLGIIFAPWTTLMWAGVAAAASTVWTGSGSGSPSRSTSPGRAARSPGSTAEARRPRDDLMIQAGLEC